MDSNPFLQQVQRHWATLSRWAHRHRRQNLVAAYLTMLAMLGYQSGVSAGLTARAALGVGGGGPARPAHSVQVHKTFADYKSMLDANPMALRRSPLPEAGLFPMETTGTVGDPLPGTGVLNIRLAGVYIAGSSSMAIVADTATQREKVFRLEECMPNSSDSPITICGAGMGKLIEVRSDRIVVLKDDRYYSFEMEGGRPSTGGSSRSNAGAGIQISGSGNQRGVSVPRAEVDLALGANFAQLMKDARVFPVIENGLPQGFQIRQIVPGSLYEKLGLQNEDIIKAVNGQQITTMEQSMKMFQIMRNESNIQLEITRGGQPMSLSYQIQ
ncbi:MAG: PDZ domain-containing protein [Deltaproteobacteria bacterium]|nr:PDZ domain-containing protein [Deltaproteobacteria bacterium]